MIKDNILLFKAKIQGLIFFYQIKVYDYIKIFMHPCRVYKGIRYCYRRNATPFSLLTNLLLPPSATNYFPFLYINHAHAFQLSYFIYPLQELGWCIIKYSNINLKAKIYERFLYQTKCYSLKIISKIFR